ncbi:hypothetical protein [Bhargavaea cecembensis]|uniref:hypothetical protein n=1 Tax=Bhargavaea cecembensis TaxID=394098 RepID=UPI000694E926|nr:hypothetical protein [Bhargavaea cecembensis]
MPVTKWILILNLTVPSSWIAVLAAMAVAYGAVRIRKGKESAGLYADAAFWFVLVWKFSYLLTHFGIFLKSPLSVLYYNGGFFGAVLGLLAVLAFLYFKGAGAEGWLLLAAVVTQSVYQLAMVFLNEGGLLPKFVTAAGFAVLLLLVFLKGRLEGGWAVQLAVLMAAVHLLAAAVQPGGLTGFPLLATVVFSIYFLSLNRMTSLQNGRHSHE